VGGCCTDRPTLVNSPATGGRQFKKQHQVQKAEDGAVDVALVCKKVNEFIGFIFETTPQSSKLNRGCILIMAIATCSLEHLCS